MTEKTQTLCISCHQHYTAESLTSSVNGQYVAYVDMSNQSELTCKTKSTKLLPIL